MTEIQFLALANLLELSEPDRHAAHAVLFGNGTACTTTQKILSRIKDADSQLRAAYIVHGPMNFRIEVGHRDTCRYPGALSLSIGERVRLSPRSTERWIVVEISGLPATARGYYRGVIVDQPAPGSAYQIGDSVEFSEDQVMAEIIRRNPKSKKPLLVK